MQSFDRFRCSLHVDIFQFNCSKTHSISAQLASFIIYASMYITKIIIILTLITSFFILNMRVHIYRKNDVNVHILETTKGLRCFHNCKTVSELNYAFLQIIKIFFYSKLGRLCLQFTSPHAFSRIALSIQKFSTAYL